MSASTQGAGLFDDSPCWTPRRRELLEWFQKEAAPLADAYEGAVNLLHNKGFPGRVHFIAHAVRDIADRLVYVLDPQLKESRVQYENAMDEIERKWPLLDSVAGSGPPLDKSEIQIPIEVATRINKLVAEHRDRRRRPSQYELLFRFLMRNEPLQHEPSRRLVTEFKKTRKWFMDLAHLPARKLPSVDERRLEAQFRKFEAMLHSFVGSFFTATREIDDILKQANQ